MITKSVLPKSNVESLAEQAHGLVAPLERGQANKPLTEALLALMEAGDAPLVISVLCLDDAARETIGPQAKSLSSASDQVACRIAQCDALREDMAAYQNFCRGAHVLLIAGSAGCELDQRQMEVVRSASQLFPLLWPIIVGSSEEQRVQWLEALCPSSVTLAPSIIGSDQVATVEWNARLQRFREPLYLQQKADGLAALIEKLAARAESELAYLTLAQSRLETPAKISPTRGGTDSDREMAPLRERLAEQSAAIDRQLSLKSERSTQPLGELSGMMRSICSSIAVEDLEQSRSASLLKLSINASHLAHLNRRLEHALRQEFIGDLQEVQRQMRRATDELLGTLCTRFQSGIQVNLPVLDVNHAWRSVENLMAIGKETHIELARKGFFDVLTAGRQKVFIIIMFASLMGRMGLPNLFTTHASKAAFGMFMGVVMIVSMVCAIMHWRREKETTSEKELSKIRDSMLADGCKVIDQVERVKLAAMRDYLKEAARTIESTVKQSLDETLAAQRAKREAELHKQEALRKSLDLRMKQAIDMQRQVVKLLEAVRSLAGSASRSVQELAACSHSSSAPPTSADLKALAAEPTAEPIQPVPPRPSIERPARTIRTTPSTSDRPRATSALAERRQRRELAS